MEAQNIWVFMEKWEGPNDWTRAVIVPLYKGKSGKDKTKNYTGITVLSTPGKVPV